uniref:DUF4150 domain-containing protein n=1 Tax=Steinernema glaseri TaxID=37863 RepID=A0A1I7Z9V5_9BILA
MPPTRSASHEDIPPRFMIDNGKVRSPFRSAGPFTTTGPYIYHCPRNLLRAINSSALSGGQNCKYTITKFPGIATVPVGQHHSC